MKTIVLYSFFLLAICVVSCKKDKTNISGKITDSWTGSALTGVTLASDPTTTTISEDASGNYTISDLSAGNYTVYASLNDYVPDTLSVSVTSGAASTVNIALNTVMGGTWTVSIPVGYTFQFKADGSFVGNYGSGTWSSASLTSGIVKWTFDYSGSPITYYGRITSSTTMVAVNGTWTATR
jgi:hypothetical protein